MTRHAGSAPRVKGRRSLRWERKTGPQRGKRDADDEEEICRTGELVISLAGSGRNPDCGR